MFLSTLLNTFKAENVKIVTILSQTCILSPCLVGYQCSFVVRCVLNQFGMIMKCSNEAINDFLCKSTMYIRSIKLMKT